MPRHSQLLYFIATLLLALPAARALADAPFGIHVIDEATHRGVPMVLLETADHTRYHTDSAGYIAITEPGLLRRRVHFAISSPGYAFAKDPTGASGITLEVKPGATAEINALRADIAQRYYRTTGVGIYRDSIMLGHDAPLPRPHINAGLLTQQGLQATAHLGRIFWAWSQARVISRPQMLIHSIAAHSELPTGKGLDPTQGIHLDYHLDTHEEPTDLIPSDAPGSTALDGLASVPDAQGTAHLIAHYTRTTPPAILAEHGLAEWNAGTRSFDRLIVLGSDYTWQYPQGHAVIVGQGSTAQLYFATPLCHTRCPATYEEVLNPASYEALALDPNTQTLAWQKAQPPITQAAEASAIATKKLPTSAARARITDAITSKPLTLRTGSVHWNAYRQHWIMLATAALDDTDHGSLYYAEAPQAEGPWHKAIRIASHASASFTSPSQLDFFDQKGGQHIYITGSYNSASKDTPQYDGNDLLYLLDLSDERLKVLGE